MSDERPTDDSLLTPGSNHASVRPGENHDVVAPGVLPGTSPQHKIRFVTSEHSDTPSTITESNELVTQTQSDPAPFDKTWPINDSSDKPGQTVSVFPDDRVEYERSVFEPVDQFRDSSVQNEFKAFGELPLAGISRASDSEKMSLPNIQVRIGNIQVEVHQPEATPVEPVVPRPVSSSDSAPRTVRLSRHYLRGW
ncbi:MAG: hypothetical protein SV201_08475 [Pseudomonadota bacterium]|nr:hypothetical protein [Pseudomonadota bacterium]